MKQKAISRILHVLDYKIKSGLDENQAFKESYLVEF
jgi:hypothetical protein